jgi:predicted nucleic acid-binding Zn ribbon protein
MKFKIGENRKNGTYSLGGLLPDIIHEYNLEKSFTIDELVSKWHTIVGDIISTHSKPDRIFKKILFVAADHSVYANEINMRKDVILKNIEEEYPYQTVRDIRVEIKTIHW